MELLKRKLAPLSEYMGCFANLPCTFLCCLPHLVVFMHQNCKTMCLDFVWPLVWEYPSAQISPPALMLPLWKECFNLTHKCLRIHVNPQIWKGSVLRASQGAGMENPCLSSPSTACRGLSELTLSAQSLKLGWKKGQSHVCWLINNAGIISQRAGVIEHFLQPVGCRKKCCGAAALSQRVGGEGISPPQKACSSQPHAWKGDESTQYGKSRNWNTSSKS